jgi:hypothetical protein
MGLTSGNIRGDSVIDYELANGAATVNVKFTTGNIAANATGTQASGTLVPTNAANVAVTSAGAAYSVTLPKALVGLEIDIVCISATNTVVVFPAGSDTINALSASAGLTMPALTSATFLCMTAGAWYTSPRVPS